ncbi:MAG: Mur ligase family protein [Wenzhouxiangella sp.]
MKLLDCRRLPGPNLLWDRPSVLLDIACSADQCDTVRATVQLEISRLHQRMHWHEPEFRTKPRIGGVSLAFDGPVDRLYAGIALAEIAWERITEPETAPKLEQSLALIAERAAEEARPALLALQAEAQKRSAPFLWDDDEVSVGFGASVQVWPADQLPRPEEIDWDAARRIPIAMITGTNGKTTSARMCARILRAAGHRVGLSSTGGIWLDDEPLDEGDYAGPGGARAILRHPQATAAVLETARGGLLRRGLGVEQADAALITNIAADHLGDFGSSSLDELKEIKWVISRAVTQSGQLVLNADDRRLVQYAQDYPGRVVWFSLDPNNTRASFRPADGWLIHEQNGRQLKLCRIDAIPLCLGGAARHNIANALAAAAVGSCLGAGPDAIAEGLTGMGQDHNPGRGNLYAINGARVLVDFAHNPAAIAAMAEMSRALPAQRRLVAFAQAGDRTDDLLRECARAVWAFRPDQIIISELAQYARGRSHGEVFGILHQELLNLGCPANAVDHVETEMEALERALNWSQPGDLLVLLILGEAEAVRERLQKLSGEG